MNRWILRPPAVQVFPPFSSALTIKTGSTDPRDRIAEGFLASLMCPGNELQNQQKTALLSGPQVSAGALSVTPDNFEQAVVVFAARRVPKNHWLNHVDQFLQPIKTLPQTLIADCAVWTLFDGKNQTVALRDVPYKGETYQIENHFFPFPVSEFTTNAPGGVCHAARTNSFAADWLLKQKLSAAAVKVLDAGRTVYQCYFANLSNMNLPKFKIETFAAGWRQINLALQDAAIGNAELTELRKQHGLLRAAILPQLREYGIFG